MNMQIDLTASASATPSDAGVRAAKSASTQPTITSLPQDHATFYSVKHLVAVALQQPPIRADRVAAIKQAIASGTYVVDPRAIASAMAEEI